VETLYEKMTVSGPLLLDGEVGGLLWKRVKEENRTKLVPASIILDEPATVKQVHLDYIEAGANVITTNTYATVRKRLDEILDCASKWEETVIAACKIAQEARKASGKDVLIAGCLPPLHGSYKPEGVGAMHEIVPVYAEHVRMMADYVDFFLCETMSTAAEGLAACSEAKKSGKPEPRWSACKLLHARKLAKMGPKIIGGHGNGFSAIPSGWKVQNGGIAALGKRQDLTPDRYTEFATHWLENGASLVGGCCQVGPEFIKSIHDMMSKRALAASGA